MKHKKRFPRLCALSLTLILVFSLSSPTLAWEERKTDILTKTPQEIDFNTLTYGEPYMDEVEATAKAAEDAAAKPDNLEETAEAVRTLKAMENRLATDYAVMSVHYASDPTAMSQTYVDWNSFYMTAVNRIAEAFGAVTDSANAGALELALGEDGAAYYAGAEADTAEQLALQNHCAELVDDYWQAMAETPVVRYKGVTYHGEEEANAALAEGKLTYEDWNQVYLLLAKEVNKVVGPLYVDLVKTWKAYAASWGYDDCAAYFYENVYIRDYTPEEAEAIHEAVKAYIVPLYELYTVLGNTPELLYGTAVLNEQFSTLSQDGLLDMVQLYMGYVSSELADLFAYMRRCHLVDTAFSETKNDQGFTTSLPQYQSAFIFNKPYMDMNDLEDLLHEFGHFSECCLSGGSDYGNSLDLAEINSQALVLLCQPYMGAMVGEENASACRFANLQKMVSGYMLSNCISDEFQQQVFAEDDLTLDKVNRIYHDVCAEYGIQLADDTYGYGWQHTSHHFVTPFYTISYVTSALASAELFTTSLSDYDKACDEYLRLMEIGTAQPFRATLKEAGMADVFREETVADIADALLDYTYDTVLGVSFSDTEGLEAEDDIRLTAAFGLFQGKADGTFRPGESLTRAQAATVLWRLNGCPEPEGASPFQDVPDDSWCADAVTWCAENGIVQGDGAGHFAPDALVTRQAMLAMLYRAVGSPEADEAVLSGVSDSDSLGEFARPGAAWAVENGLVDGALQPQGQVSRGEAAELLAALIAV